MTLPRSAMLALPAVTAFVFLLLYGPLLVPIVSSLFTLDHGSILWDQPSLQSYAALARNETILEAITNTLFVGAAAVVADNVTGVFVLMSWSCPCRRYQCPQPLILSPMRAYGWPSAPMYPCIASS